MGLTSAMNTALTGLTASQQRLDVIGNNISNVNTLAYKSDRTIFQNQLSRTMSSGSAPNGVSGGTNPMQVGLGVSTAAIQKDFTNGSIDPTGLNSDVAIQGSGFFVLQNSQNAQLYSRDGAFELDANQNLVNVDGNYVLGYPVDADYNIVNATPSKLKIPIGRLSIAQATQNANLSGNLNSGVDTGAKVGVTPGSATSETLVDQNTGVNAIGTTLLTDLATGAKPGIGLFSANDVITLDAKKGGRGIVPAPTFTVTNTTTVADYMQWLQGNMGLDPAAPQGTPAGVAINNGQITVTGNLGEANVPEISLASSGAVPTPFTWNTTTPDDVGSSQYTEFLAYDSLGNPVSVGVTFILESTATTGNTWRFIAESTDDSDMNKFLGSGTLTYDNNGKLIESTGTNITVNRANVGSADPINMTLDFSGTTGLANGVSSVKVDTQDGCSTGTLTDYSISEDGTIVGSFSNGVSRDLGQIVLANFTNPQGLVSIGNNAFAAGPNSGNPIVGAPDSNGNGSLIGGALELSNVDITAEFIDMISASTAFSASGKVITTSQQMLSELMSIFR
jgi:flagellar hook protein FlgE